MNWMNRSLAIAALLWASATSTLRAHDTWVQTNTNIIRAGDAVHVDLMLGNHGNDHRDFKLASKTTLDGAVLKIISPQGKSYDLKDRLTDIGYTPKEGFWTSRFAATEPGLYLVEHTRDSIVNHGGSPSRSIRSGKTFFVVSKSLDKVSDDNPGFDKALGHPLEIVPEASTVTPMGPDVPIRVKVLFQGKPLKEARVSFIPRGETLSEEFDTDYERKTNDNGRCMFIPKEGNYYLVAVHHKTEEKGSGYESTAYSATLTVFVPEICPCCGE